MMATLDLSRALQSVGPVPADLDRSRALWAAFRALYDLSAEPVPFLTAPTGNHKEEITLENDGLYVYTLALAPASLSGLQTCAFHTAECERGCIGVASGHNELDHNKLVKVVRTRFLFHFPDAAMALICFEIDRARAKHGDKLAVRLNAYSDLRWEKICPWLFVRFSDVHFYDYTKWALKFRQTPCNYHLTYSASERTDDDDIGGIVAGRRNVAVVFSTRRGQPLPATWHGVAVVDGDRSDARFNDPDGVVVGLRAKGRMRRGEWGMVRPA